LFYSNYLKKRGVSFHIGDFPIFKEEKIFFSIIIIPSYSESEYLEMTLKSLNEQVNFNLSDLLVIIVVNNSINDPRNIIDDNIKTIELIQSFKSNYTLKYIDVSTENNALSESLSGVGYARKIGMDFALKYSNKETILHCLDADTIVSPSYLSKITSSYQLNRPKALIVDFEHQMDSSEELNKYVKKYEDFLKETARYINESGSPYGYVALGPTITCLALTYVKVGGMVNKKATEDFYFLQQIRKFSNIYFLNEKLVFPSSRLSDRVYLGTGFRMNKLLKGEKIKSLYYSEDSFEILGKSIVLILSLYNETSASLKKELISINASLDLFFLKEGLFDVWEKINKESKTASQFELQFHKWFDNLKTLRLLKFYS